MTNFVQRVLASLLPLACTIFAIFEHDNGIFIISGLAFLACYFVDLDERRT